MEKRSPIESLAFYREAPDPLRRRLAEAATPVTLPPGDAFYREGDHLEIFAIVVRGDIRVFKEEANGREISLYHVLDGQPCLVNSLCVLLGRPTMASARVEVATEAVCFDGTQFREWVQEERHVREFVFATMSSRLVDFMTLIEEVAFRKMDLRLAELLQRKFARGPHGRVIAATHEELASELGTAREVVSRLLKDFERAGMLSLARGHVELVDEDRLRRLLGIEVA